MTIPSHGTQADMAVLEEIVRRLVEAYRPDQVYLFGSYARGEAGPDSDFDLMVIVPDNATGERRGSRLAYQVLWGLGAAADVVVWPRTRFDERRQLLSSLPATILIEGRLLYEQ